MSKVQPFMKAIAPALLTLVAVLVHWLVVGDFDRTTLAIGITGLVSAVVSYFVPNRPALEVAPKPQPVVPPPPPPAV